VLGGQTATYRVGETANANQLQQSNQQHWPRHTGGNNDSCAIASAVKAIRSPAATNAAARLRSPTSAPATSKSAIPMSTMVMMSLWITSILQHTVLSPPRTLDPQARIHQGPSNAPIDELLDERSATSVWNTTVPPA
jgi:hypothetical protein